MGERGQRGQASVELVAVLPALLLAAVIAAHFLPVGWALWSAADAARAGARAEHVGADPERAARGSLPPPLRTPGRDSIAVGERGVAVEVSVPSLVPAVDAGGVRARARLEPDGG